MVLNFLWQQIFGVLMLIYGLFLDKHITLLSGQFISYAIGLFGTAALGGMAAYLIFKISPYKD
jgi:hypothetical protein